MIEGREQHHFNTELMQLPETNFEKLDRIMGEASMERAALFAGTMVDGLRSLNQSEVFQKAINLSPLVGDYIMAAKAFKGTEAGVKLSGRERAMYSIGVTVQAVSLVMVYWGLHQETLALNVASEAVTNGNAVWGLTKKAVEFAAGKSPKLAHIIDAASAWLSKESQVLPQLDGAIKASVATFNPEKITFDQNEAGI